MQITFVTNHGSFYNEIVKSFLRHSFTGVFVGILFCRTLLTYVLLQHIITNRAG